MGSDSQSGPFWIVQAASYQKAIVKANRLSWMLVAVREGAILAGPQGPLWHWLSERKHHQAGRLARQRLDLRVLPLQGKVQKRIVRAATRGLPKWPHFSLPPTHGQDSASKRLNLQRQERGGPHHRFQRQKERPTRPSEGRWRRDNRYARLQSLPYLRVGSTEGESLAGGRQS
jgi:hypothetical protein